MTRGKYRVMELLMRQMNTDIMDLNFASENVKFDLKREEIFYKGNVYYPIREYKSCYGVVDLDGNFYRLVPDGITQHTIVSYYKNGYTHYKVITVNKKDYCIDAITDMSDDLNYTINLTNPTPVLTPEKAKKVNSTNIGEASVQGLLDDMVVTASIKLTYAGTHVSKVFVPKEKDVSKKSYNFQQAMELNTLRIFKYQNSEAYRHGYFIYDMGARSEEGYDLIHVMYDDEAYSLTPFVAKVMDWSREEYASPLLEVFYVDDRAKDTFTGDTAIALQEYFKAYEDITSIEQYLQQNENLTESAIIEVNERGMFKPTMNKTTKLLIYTDQFKKKIKELNYHLGMYLSKVKNPITITDDSVIFKLYDHNIKFKWSLSAMSNIDPISLSVLVHTVDGELQSVEREHKLYSLDWGYEAVDQKVCEFKLLHSNKLYVTRNEDFIYFYLYMADLIDIEKLAYVLKRGLV